MGDNNNTSTLCKMCNKELDEHSIKGYCDTCISFAVISVEHDVMEDFLIKYEKRLRWQSFKTIGITTASTILLFVSAPLIVVRFKSGDFVGAIFSTLVLLLLIGSQASLINSSQDLRKSGRKLTICTMQMAFEKRKELRHKIEHEDEKTLDKLMESIRDEIEQVYEVVSQKRNTD